MNTNFRYIGILLSFFLLAILLAGCDSPPWESGMTLSLKIDTPKNGTTVTTSMVTVSGRVLGTQSEGAKLTINNATVPIKDKKYSTSVTLTEGANVINFVASSSGGVTLNEKVTVTYAPAK